MSKPELVLSNTTTFFSGNLKNVFKKAKKYGFKYLEIVPYRWTSLPEILDLEKRYQVKVVGIHLPPAKSTATLEKILEPIWNFYLGPVEENPGLELAKYFSTHTDRHFYLLFHADLAAANKNFKEISKKNPVVVENIPYYNNVNPLFWDIQKISKAFPDSAYAFDPGHFKTIPNPNISILEAYSLLRPKIIHISYNRGFFHTLPNAQDIKELKSMLQIHIPNYLVLETNPLVSVKKGREIMEKIINLSWQAS